MGSGAQQPTPDDKAPNSSDASGSSNNNIFYHDIAVFAFPTPPGDSLKMSDSSPKITASVMDTNFDSAKLMDGDPKTAITLPRPEGGKPQFIQVEFAEPYQARTLMLAMRGLGQHEECHCGIQVSDDGQTFRTLSQFDPEAAPVMVNLGTVE